MSTSTTQNGARQLERSGLLDDLIDLQQRLRNVERELELMDDKQEAHLRAKKQDAKEVLDRGDEEIIVIGTPPREADGECAIGHIQGIVTFVDPGQYTLERADVVRVKIYDVGKNHAHALAVRHEEEDDE